MRIAISCNISTTVWANDFRHGTCIPMKVAMICDLQSLTLTFDLNQTSNSSSNTSRTVLANKFKLGKCIPMEVTMICTSVRCYILSFILIYGQHLKYCPYCWHGFQLRDIGRPVWTLSIFFTDYHETWQRCVPWGEDSTVPESTRKYDPRVMAYYRQKWSKSCTANCSFRFRSVFMKSVTDIHLRMLM